MYAFCYGRNNTLTGEPGEALGIAAQIAVALAGFAGVVVVFCCLNKAAHRLPGENLLHSFGLMKATVIHRELSST
jgi:hypothetical protein